MLRFMVSGFGFRFRFQELGISASAARESRCGVRVLNLRTTTLQICAAVPRRARN